MKKFSGGRATALELKCSFHEFLASIYIDCLKLPEIVFLDILPFVF